MFIKNLFVNGLLYQCTNLDQLKQLMNCNKIVAYIGFDCTAKSLHVGHLTQIMVLRLLQKYGHKIIIIIGNATTQIGDPTGRDKMRKILSKDEINDNTNNIKRIISKFIQFDINNFQVLLLNNSNWLESLYYLNFLRNFGSYFSVNRMLSMDFVKSRLLKKNSITFLELNYMLLQAYDFYFLYQNYGCVLQIGGSDQWGNIVVGVDFIKKIIGKEVFGITTPLMVTSSGNKMGKSVDGAIWLDENMLSPYEYYQYWRNCSDKDVIRFAQMYSEFDIYQMQDFKNLVIKNINEAKKQLAFVLTSICHGVIAAELALNTSIKVFEKKQFVSSLPIIYIKREFLNHGLPVYILLYESSLVKSKSESKRLIKSNAVRINDILISECYLLIDKYIINNNFLIKVSIGKKRHFLLEFV